MDLTRLKSSCQLSGKQARIVEA
jgi:hypothetical protein